MTLCMPYPNGPCMPYPNCPCMPSSATQYEPTAMHTVPFLASFQPPVHASPLACQLPCELSPTACHAGPLVQLRGPPGPDPRERGGAHLPGHAGYLGACRGCDGHWGEWKGVGRLVLRLLGLDLPGHTACYSPHPLPPVMCDAYRRLLTWRLPVRCCLPSPPPAAPSASHGCCCRDCPGPPRRTYR